MDKQVLDKDEAVIKENVKEGTVTVSRRTL